MVYPIFLYQVVLEPILSHAVQSCGTGDDAGIVVFIRAKLSKCKADQVLELIMQRGRDMDLMQRGRIRVQLKREDGTLSNPAIPLRKQLMLHVAELVPRNPGRTKKQEHASTSKIGQKWQLEEMSCSHYTAVTFCL